MDIDRIKKLLEGREVSSLKLETKQATTKKKQKKIKYMYRLAQFPVTVIKINTRTGFRTYVQEPNKENRYVYCDFNIKTGFVFLGYYERIDEKRAFNIVFEKYLMWQLLTRLNKAREIQPTHKKNRGQLILFEKNWELFSKILKETGWKRSPESNFKDGKEIGIAYAKKWKL